MRLENTCEGTNAATVTASNSAGPDQFSSKGLSGTGNTLTYSNTHAHGGTTCVKPHLGTTSGAAYIIWTFTSVATAFCRQYLWIDAAPSVNTRLISYVDSGGTLLRAALTLNTARKLLTLNSAATTIATSTTVIPTGQWVRLEYDVTGNASTGVMTCRIYLSPESTTPDQTLNNTAQNTGGTIGQIWMGQTASGVTSTDTYEDDLVVTDVGPVGPVAGPAAIPDLVMAPMRRA